MDENTLKRWLESGAGILYPPGTIAVDIVPGKMRDQSLEIGVIHQHRFAFFFWAQNFIRRNKDCNGRPSLVSIDYHYDVGNDDTLNDQREDLKLLNLNDTRDVSLFCWLRLNPNDDTQILPALYMNFFSNAYILLKQNNVQWKRCVVDANGREHHLTYYQQPTSLATSLSSLEGPIYLDIDLDYFSTESADGMACSVSDHKIRQILSLKHPLMANILPRLVGLTIAVESKFCGGISNAINVLNILDDELFDGSLMGRHCRWHV